jgi:hypothetical protein
VKVVAISGIVVFVRFIAKNQIIVHKPNIGFDARKERGLISDKTAAEEEAEARVVPSKFDASLE